MEAISTDLFQETLAEKENDNSTTKSDDDISSNQVVTCFIAEQSRLKRADSDDDDSWKLIASEKRFTIECSRSSTVELVGLQVWRGALLLSDYILTHPDEFSGKFILELAAGTGITSIAAAELASHILCTDVDRGEILPTIRRNFQLNSDLVRAEIDVEEIDFYSDTWKSKLQNRIEKVQVILVADVVYDPELTRRFFSSLEHVLGQARDSKVVVYFSIEKRQRVDESGSVFAPNFDLFIDLLQKLSHNEETGYKLSRLDLDFEQRLKCYDRVEELFLWKMVCEKSSHNNNGVSCKG